MKIQLKRSSVLDAGSAKTPTAAQLEYGELAINYNTSDPAIFLKDSNNNIIRISGVGNIADDGQVELPASTTPPSSPEDGNLWYNSDQGRLYIYYNDGNTSQWVDASPDSWDPSTYPDTTNSSSQSGTLDDRYVMANGDDMTGNLTLGTDKVVLNATSGNATLEGDLNTGTFSSGSTTTAGTNVLASGQINIQQASGSTGYFTRGFRGSTETYYVKADGSASFTGNVQSGSNPDAGANEGALIRKNGRIQLASNQGSTSLWSGYTVGTSTTTSQILADGSASFAGAISVDGGTTNENSTYGPGYLIQNRSQAARNLWTGQLNGSNTSTILADGSATFANNVAIGAADLTQGRLFVTNTPTTSTENLIVLGDGNGLKTFLKSDGSATFNSDVTVATAVIAGSSSYLSSPIQGTTNKSDRTAILGVNHHTSGDVFEGRRGDTSATTSRINALGSAEFAGTVNTGSWPNNASTSTGGGAYLARQDTSTSVVWKALSGGTGSSNVTSQILANGSATFGQALNSTNNNGILLGADVGQFNLYTTRYSTDAFQILNTSGSGTNVAVRFDGDGSARFAGPVYSGGYTNGSQTEALAAQISTSHTVGLLIGSTSSSLNANTAIQVKNSSGTEVVDIKADGSAAFNGNVVVASSAGSGGTNANSQLGTYSASNSYLGLYNTNATKVAGNPTFFIYDRTNTAYKARIWQDGSAEFAAGVTATGNNTSSGITVNTTAAGKGVTVLGSSGGDIRLKGDGSATFTGNIELGGVENNSIALRRDVGSIRVSSSNSSQTVFAAQHNTNTNATISANGSATFANAITSGDGTSTDGHLNINRIGQTSTQRFIKLTSSGTDKVLINANGSATFASDVNSEGALVSDRTSGTSGCLVGKLNGSTTSSIKADGAATFAGQVAVGDFGATTSAGPGVAIEPGGLIDVQRSTAGSSRCFGAWGGTVNTASIFSDGSATFAGGNINLYANGSAVLAQGATFGGNILPAIDAGFAGHSDLGSSSKRYEDAYVRDGVTTGSDRNYKSDIRELLDAERSVAVACKSLLRAWKWTDAVSAKGDAARIHIGIIAQDLEQAFADQGLDAHNYAMFCEDTWYEVDGQQEDADGDKYTADSEGAVAVTRLSVRYHELLAFIIAAI